jgi:hypothetical protein
MSSDPDRRRVEANCIRTLPASKPGPTEIEPCQTLIFPAADFSDLDFLAIFSDSLGKSSDSEETIK